MMTKKIYNNYKQYNMINKLQEAINEIDLFKKSIINIEIKTQLLLILNLFIKNTCNFAFYFIKL